MVVVGDRVVNDENEDKTCLTQFAILQSAVIRCPNTVQRHSTIVFFSPRNQFTARLPFHHQSPLAVLAISKRSITINNAPLDCVAPISRWQFPKDSQRLSILRQRTGSCEWERRRSGSDGDTCLSPLRPPPRHELGRPQPDERMASTYQVQ